MLWGNKGANPNDTVHLLNKISKMNIDSMVEYCHNNHISVNTLKQIVHEYNIKHKRNKRTIKSSHILIKYLRDYEELISIAEEVLGFEIQYDKITEHFHLQKENISDNSDIIGSKVFYAAVKEYNLSLLNSLINSNNVDSVLENDQNLLLRIITNNEFADLNQQPVGSHAEDLEHIRYLCKHRYFLSEEFVDSFIAQQIQVIKEEEEVTEQIIMYVLKRLKKQYQINYELTENESISENNLKHSGKQIVSERWDQYLCRLDEVLAAVKYRSENGFELNEIMPTQKEILELQAECKAITEEWYGVGNSNLSCFYAYIVKMCRYAHITMYDYANVEFYISDDKSICNINLDDRARALQVEDAKHRIPFEKAGGRWATGRSAIDSATMANILHKDEAVQLKHLILAKKMLTIIIRTIQEDILKNTTAVGNITLHYDDDDIRKIPWQLLCQYGKPIESFGQLPMYMQEHLWVLIKQHYPNAPDEDNIFVQFARFVAENPGGYYLGNEKLLQEVPEFAEIEDPKIKHLIIKTAGIWSKKLKLFRRTVVENLTPRRYIVESWERKYPFAGVDVNGNKHILRDAWLIETMRVWSNEMPYRKVHGMSLSSSGMIEGLQHHGASQYDWNLPVDHNASLPNLNRDIEKMFRELYILCPKIKANNLLPRECLLDISQNAASFSSIHATQHLHVSNTCLREYPLYSESSKPIAKPELSANIDIVQVGSTPDAILLKFEFNDLKNEALIQKLVEFQADIYHHFGGVDSFDCFTHLVPDEYGNFVFIFHPLARLTKEGLMCTNIDTGAQCYTIPQFYTLPTNNKQAPFPDARNNGREFVTEFFDCTAKQGVREFIVNYFQYPDKN